MENGADRTYQKPACESKPAFGRPWLIPDLDLVEDLAGIGCTDEDIAQALHVSVSWIEKRKVDSPDFLRALENGRSHIKESLRRAQLKKALAGNPAMLIWTGKQILGQRDKPAEPPDTRRHVLELIVPPGHESVTVDSNDPVSDPGAAADLEAGDDAPAE